MNIEKKYDVLIIGGGISACVFASNFLKNNINSKIAIVETGKGLGGRSSTRISRMNKGWKLNHGSPNFNICNENRISLLDNFIKELLDNKFIKFDDSEFFQISRYSKIKPLKNSEFTYGNNYNSVSTMRELSQNIININNSRNQIDFYFDNLIVNLAFKRNHWHLLAHNGNKFISKFLVSSSNLLLHKRSIDILKTNQIPLRKAIPLNKDKKIDSLLNIIDQQSYIPRLSFMIYTKSDYSFKDFYSKKYRYFYLEKDLENEFKFERVVFQLQDKSKLGIVVHTKSKDFIIDYLKNGEDKCKEIVIKRFNNLFKGSNYVNQLYDYEDISIMKWRASQPLGIAAPLDFQFCENFKIGFCGDWFKGEGFGRIEGAILSSLLLAKKFKTLN